jgi:hypothetical protein
MSREAYSRLLRAQRQARWRGRDELRELHLAPLQERSMGKLHPMPQSVRYDPDRP